MPCYKWILFSLSLVGLSQAQQHEPDFAYFIEPQTQESPQSFRVYLSPELGASSLDLDMGLNLAVVFPHGPLLRVQSFHLMDLKGDNSMQGQSLSLGYSRETRWGWVNGDAGPLWAKTRHNDFTHDPISREGFGIDSHIEVVKAFRFVGIGLALDWRYMPGIFNLTSASLILPLGRLSP